MAKKDYGKFQVIDQHTREQKSKQRKLKNRDALRRKRAAYIKAIFLACGKLKGVTT